jgi:hypothetical protein
LFFSSDSLPLRLISYDLQTQHNLSKLRANPKCCKGCSSGIGELFVMGGDIPFFPWSDCRGRGAAFFFYAVGQLSLAEDRLASVLIEMRSSESVL